MYDIICFGSATRDIFIDTGLKEVGRDIAYPVGAKIPIKKLHIDIGGVGINVAVGTSRMGLKTAYFGKFGDDEASEAISGMLKKEKIEFLGEKTKGITGYGFILDSYEKHRTILTHHGLNDNIKESEVDKSKLKTKWLFLSSLRGDSIKTEEKLVYWAKKQGIKTAFNMDAKVLKKYNINLKKILKQIDVLILNKEEAQHLTPGRTGEELAEKISKLGPKIVVITDGEKPVFAQEGGKKYKLTPPKTKVVEVTGAGDAFTAGFLSSYTKTNDTFFSLKIAAENAKSVVQHYGTHNVLLSWKNACEMVKKHS